MAFIKLQVKILSSPEGVYALLRRPDKFATFLKDINKVAAAPETDNMLICDWQADIDGARIIWKEKNIYDDEARKVFFRMIEGDFEEYFGTWSVTEEADGESLLTLEASINWGAPNFTKFVDSTVMKKVKRSLQAMLWGIKKKAEA